MPRFSDFRRQRIEIWHECSDLDLALWLDSQERLGELRRAASYALRQAYELGTGAGIVTEQLDTFLFAAGSEHSLGRLCRYNECPKGKPQCVVPGCGAVPFNKRIAEFEPPANTTTDLQNPRVAATIYELSWPWNTTINETLKTLEGVEEPRFCVSIPLGPIPDSVTKAYKETDLGDCTNALGEQCTRDLKNQGFAPDVGCNTPIPESCSG
ncbi:MAG: hypothetical protein EOO38_27440 [Cytophagaceae bacterium]|nr:MAG: hypothetical protein EOO38_27440 [Cytophagaceae bacterium]